MKSTRANISSPGFISVNIRIYFLIRVFPRATRESKQTDCDKSVSNYNSSAARDEKSSELRGVRD